MASLGFLFYSRSMQRVILCTIILLSACWSATADSAWRDIQPPGTNVTCLRFSSDSRRLAGGGSDGRVYLWDVDTGRLQATLDTSTQAIRSVAFVGRDGLAASVDDGAVYCWDGQTRLRRSWKDAGRLLDVSKDGRWLAACNSDDFSIRLYSLRNDEAAPRTLVEKRADIGGCVNALRFLSDSRLCAVGNFYRTDGATLNDGLLLYVEPTNSRQEWLKLGFSINALDFTPDGRLTAFGLRQPPGEPDEGGLMVQQDGATVISLREAMPVFSVAVDPHGRWVAGLAGRVSVWELPSGQKRRILDTSDRVVSIAASPDGYHLAISTDSMRVTLYETSGF
jgi:WD40 repeat protein